MKHKKDNENNNPRFELVIQLRDHMGNETGKTKSFTSDYAEDIERYWLQNNTSKNREKYEQSQTRRNKSKRSNRKTTGTDRTDENK